MIKEYSGIQVTINEEDLNKQGVIYLLEFPNAKVYIGQTTQKLQKRLKSHCSRTSKHSSKIKQAIQKYKEFKVSALSSNLTSEQLNVYEVFFIKAYNSKGTDGYNLDSGGKNFIKSEESKKKMSEAQKGHKVSNETKKKISESHKGKIVSDKTKNRMSESRKGCKLSEVTKKKISDSNSGKISEKKRKALSKKVKSIPDDIIFSSVNEAIEYYKISKLSRYYNGKIHKLSGQTFILLEE
jgi:group I intron endonuclease